MVQFDELIAQGRQLWRSTVLRIRRQGKPKEPERYVIIGPEKAGKTVLVAALYMATLKFDGEQLPDGQELLEVKMHSKSDAMTKLIEASLEIFEKDGRMPIAGTQDLAEYTFEYEVRWRDDANLLFKARTNKTEFTLLDGPGGALFGGKATETTDDRHMAEYKEALIKAMQRASGILLCIDSSNEKGALLLFRMLPMILIEASQRGDFKCKKLVVCLTKADAYFAEHADRALAQLKRSSPSLRALTLLTQPGYRALRQTLPHRLQAYAGWTSVYGYLTNGQVNYDKEADALRIRPPDDPPETAIEMWQPFRVIEPFVYLSTGLTMNLEAFR